MIEHNCVKLNKSQTDHDICDIKENTTTTPVGHSIHLSTFGHLIFWGGHAPRPPGSFCAHDSRYG